MLRVGGFMLGPPAAARPPATTTRTCACSSPRTTRSTRTAGRTPMALPPEVWAVFTAKTARTLCYGFLGIALPVYLSELGLGATAIGVAVTLTLARSAGLTWAVRR